MQEQILRQKLNSLEQILLAHGKIAIAFSGGVDSTFLVYFAKKVLGEDNVLALTAKAPNFAPDEISFAKEYAAKLGIRHLFIELDMDTPVPNTAISSNNDMRSIFQTNAPDRCYHCKHLIFSQLLAFLASDKTLASYVLCDGTNEDDKHDYRPGLKALAELKIESPLAASSLTKPEIRLASKNLGIPIWDKPAFACLASRIPFGEPITEEKLSSIYTLEHALREEGFVQCRVRHHGDVARIELLPDDIPRFSNDEALRERIHALANSSGFAYTSLDIIGYRMGSLNLKKEDF